MLDEDLARLDRLAAATNLARLEAGVWAGIEGATQRDHAGKLIAAIQAIMLVAAVLGSAGAGLRAAANMPETDVSVLTAPGPLSPSSLLEEH